MIVYTSVSYNASYAHCTVVYINCLTVTQIMIIGEKKWQWNYKILFIFVSYILKCIKKLFNKSSVKNTIAFLLKKLLTLLISVHEGNFLVVHY